MTLIQRLGGRKNILEWGLIILNFYLVVTNNPNAVAFMGWSAAIAGIGVGGNIISKVADNMKDSEEIQ